MNYTLLAFPYVQFRLDWHPGVIGSFFFFFFPFLFPLPFPFSFSLFLFSFPFSLDRPLFVFAPFSASSFARSFFGHSFIHPSIHPFVHPSIRPSVPSPITEQGVRAARDSRVDAQAGRSAGAVIVDSSRG
eukprot:m.183973 g.183973  ORF g.183973 m.183973 type:complete len:130 (+) comp16661_c6_seq1:107-496(+)